MMEHYIGVDLHKAFFQACAVSGDGRAAVGAALSADVRRGSRRSRRGVIAQTAVAVEASTPTWHFADALAPRVGELRIVDAAEDAASRRAMRRRRIGWMPAGWRMRCGAIASSASTIRRWRFGSCGSCVADGTRWCRCGRGSCNRLRAVLLRQGLVEARRLACRPTMRWLDDAGVTAAGCRQRAAICVSVLAMVRREVAASRREVQRSPRRDPIVGRLQAHRAAWGPCSALLIRAEIGDIQRFPTPGHLASYAGLVPRVDASAGRYRYGRITRRGLAVAALGAGRSRDPQPEAHGSRLAGGLAASRSAKGALKARVALRARVSARRSIRRWITIVMSSPGRRGRAFTLTAAWSFRE